MGVAEESRSLGSVQPHGTKEGSWITHIPLMFAGCNSGIRDDVSWSRWLKTCFRCFAVGGFDIELMGVRSAEHGLGI